MRLEHLNYTSHTRRKVHSILTGRHASKLRGRGLDFSEVRKYVAGDDIRSIDWRVTARTGETHTKVFHEEKERPVFVVIDQSRAMFFGSQRYTKCVIAAQAAAVVAFHTVKAGDRLGGIIFDNNDHDYVIPRNSKAAVDHFLQCIVKRMEKLPDQKKVETNQKLLTKYLHQTAGSVTNNHVIIVISDFSDIDDESKQHLTNLSWHNDVILVHISDPLDARLPEGKLMMADGEHQIIWQNSRHDSGKKYEDHARFITDRFPKEMLHYNIPVVQLDTLTPGNDQIIKLLAKALSR